MATPDNRPGGNGDGFIRVYMPSVAKAMVS